jgi:RNA polymerase sigma-70 factor (ECF subfamily)
MGGWPEAVPADVDRDDVTVPSVDDAQGPLDVAAARVREFAAVFASESAFRAFYDRSLPSVYGYLLRRCGGDASLAEDLAQTAFIEAVQRRGSYDGRSDPLTWIIGIARHKLVDTWRRQARDEHRRLQLEVREIALSAEDRPWRQADDGEQLAALLGRLPALQRAALVLHYGDGLPVREAARRIHRSESATESLLTRGRVALREAWQEASHD